MSRNSYRKYYKDKDVEKDEIVEDVKDEEVKEENIEDVKDEKIKEENIEDVKDEEVKDEEIKDEEIKDGIVEDAKDDEITIGVVVNCSKLNVRRTANRLAKVLTVIEKGTSVIIENAKPSNGFYKVKVNDIEGYCVKDYIEIR